MVSRIKYTFTITWLLLLCSQPLWTQSFNIARGLPFIRNYSPEEYRAHEKNYELLQSSDGIMYFANFAGVLQFDGANWNKIPSSSGMRILSLKSNEQGKIFVGGLYDFGYLDNDVYGQTHFVSLVPKEYGASDIGLIFKVLCIGDKVWFVSENKLFMHDGKKIEVKNLNSKLLSAFQVGDELFFFFDTKNAISKLSGLQRYKGGKFQKVQMNEGQTLFDIRFMISSIKTNEILIGSENQGLFYLDNNVVKKFNSEANEFLKSHRLSCGIIAGKSMYAIGTNVGGIVLVNEKGKIIQVINQTGKLQDESINSLYLDKGKSLWASTNNGISKVEINWPLSYIDNKTSGLKGKVQRIEYYKNKLYFATDEGLFFLEGSVIKKIDRINAACLSLLKISDQLLIASSRGIYHLKGNTAQLIDDNNFTFCLTKSETKSTIFYAGHNTKMSVYQINKNKPLLIKTVKDIPGDVLKIVDDNAGDIYLEVSPGKIFIVKNKTNQLIELGSKSNFLSLHLNKLNGEVFFSSEKGLYVAGKDYDFFKPYFLQKNDSLSQKMWIHDLFEISENTRLVNNGEQKQLSFLSIKENNFEINQTPFLPVASFAVQTIWVNPEGAQLWAGGKDGLLLSNYKDLYDYNANYQTILRKVTSINNDSLLNLSGSVIQEIDYSNNSIQFEFSVPVFPATGFVEFRYYLKGFDKDTSTWTTQTKKEYTNLPDNSYEFMVEARNEFGKIAKKTDYSFRILTPLYRQWWAIAIYVLIILLLGRLILVWRMRASKKEKERLEELVKERTEEIEQSRKKIEEQRDIAYKHRKEILDSISYAQKIQQAVLPSQQYAEDILLEHFIFYKPRDIVSGDFYWMKKLNNYVVVVAADCTGHGVPGAFMSMLGSSFLNEIVTRRSLDNAAQILNRLRSKVKKSLHQEGKEGEQKDGMDIALLIIDNESFELQYAGAYNPLYIIRPKAGINSMDENLDPDSRFELIHLKADRQPIGIHLAEKEFTNHQFQLKQGDCLYSFSDGYVDQFGGETGEKFKTKRFKDLLMSVQKKPMHEQKQILEQAFMKWKRDLAQIDDVLVMGIRI